MSGSTTHDWSERLSAYLDGDLPAELVAETERHLGECARCRQILEELRTIVAVAPGYAGEAPGKDLWPGIAREIEAGRTVAFPRRPKAVARRFSLIQLVAASLAFAVLGGGSAWLMLRPDSPAVVATAASPVAVGEVAALPVALAARADSAYDGAVADLEQVLREGRSRLDTATVRVIEENLAVIDRAIAEARAAIERDPANAWLRTAMAANMRRKLDLLHRASSAIATAEL